MLLDFIVKKSGLKVRDVPFLLETNLVSYERSKSSAGRQEKLVVFLNFQLLHLFRGISSAAEKYLK